MDRIIKSYVDDFLKSQQIEEKDESKQFEMFATYCSIMQNYTDEFSISDVITGEGNDCGIDGIAILVNGMMINNLEEIDDLLECNSKILDAQFIFVQSKVSNSFSGGEIGTFCAGVLDFFSENHQLIQNEFIKKSVK